MKFGIKKIKLCKVIYAVLIPGVNLFAQANSSAIIENSLQAIGGRKEIAKVQNFRAVADCAGPNGNYTTEIYSAKNGRLIFKQIRANGDIYQGQTNGQIFWTREEKIDDFALANEKAVFVWRTHEFQSLAMEIDRRFRDFVLAGEENFGGTTAVKLNAIDELGKPASIYFDKDSNLMLGFVIQNPFNKEPEQIRTVFNEWKQIGKLKLPSKVTATDKQGDFVLNFRKISLNKTDEKIFDVPLKVSAMNELSELLKQARAAHFNRDAKLLVSTFTDDFTSISNGEIQKPAREASLSQFQNYFNNSTFLEWDDITPPVIKVSDDATLGYAFVHKKVRRLAKDAQGKEQEKTRIFAWIEVYRKINNEWKLTAVVSTNTPEIDE